MMSFIIADDGLYNRGIAVNLDEILCIKMRASSIALKNGKTISLDYDTLYEIIEKIDLQQRTPMKEVAEQLRVKYSAYKSSAGIRTYASAYADGIKCAASMLGVDTSDWD